MSQYSYDEITKSGKSLAALEIVGAALALALFTISPAHATEREAAAIACPRTVASPAAQKRLDAGEKPEIEKSRYKPGLINPQGFCTITLSPNGKRMIQTYNEATSVGQIPVRFEYGHAGLYGYAGPKGMPLGEGQADMVCYAPQVDEYAVECTISLTPDGTMFFRRKEGRGVDESSVSIDAKQTFGIDLRAPEALTHYQIASSGTIENGSYRQFYGESPADCSQPYWKNVAQVIKLSAGRRNGQAAELTKSFEMIDADPNIFVRSGESPQMFPRFEMKNGSADAIISSVMTSEVVQVDVETACEGKLSKAFLTELPRVMNYVYDAIKPRMFKQQ
jgi:hypothetical protein